MSLTLLRQTELLVCSMPIRVYPCFLHLLSQGKSCFSRSSSIGSHCSAPMEIFLKEGLFTTRTSETRRFDTAKISHVLAKPARLGT